MFHSKVKISKLDLREVYRNFGIYQLPIRRLERWWKIFLKESGLDGLTANSINSLTFKEQIFSVIYNIQQCESAWKILQLIWKRQQTLTPKPNKDQTKQKETNLNYFNAKF